MLQIDYFGCVSIRGHKLCTLGMGDENRQCYNLQVIVETGNFDHVNFMWESHGISSTSPASFYFISTVVRKGNGFWDVMQAFEKCSAV